MLPLSKVTELGFDAAGYVVYTRPVDDVSNLSTAYSKYEKTAIADLRGGKSISRQLRNKVGMVYGVKHAYCVQQLPAVFCQGLQLR